MTRSSGEPTLFTAVYCRFLLRRALNAYAVGDYPGAERLLLALRDREGETPRVLRNLGLTRMAAGDLAGAEALFAKDLERHGATSDRLKALADVAYLAGDRLRAERRFAEALADPDCPCRTLFERRIALCSDATAYGEALRGKEAFAQGSACLEAQDTEAALAAFRRAVAADPTDFAALNNIGGILLNQCNDPEGAAQAFAQALELQPLPLVRANLALAEARCKEPAP